MSARSIGPALLVLGGLLLLVAMVFTWATVSGSGTSIAVNGFNQDGYITDVFGVLLIIFGLLAMRPRTWVSVVATIIAALAAGWAAIVLAAINNFSSYYPDVTAEGVTVSVGIGVFIVLVGAVLGLIGAVASFFGRRARSGVVAAAPAPPPPPAAPA